MFSPMPTPPMSTSRMAVPVVSVASQRENSTKARARQIMPANTTIRYPIRSTRRALAADSTTHPITKGVRTKPAIVAEEPATCCRKSGTNEIAPNIAIPAKKPVATAASTIRLAKSPRGTIGSGARRSTAMNAPSATTATASAPRTSSPPQAPTRPAWTAPSSSAETPVAKSAIPA